MTSKNAQGATGNDGSGAASGHLESGDRTSCSGISKGCRVRVETASAELTVDATARHAPEPTAGALRPKPLLPSVRYAIAISVDLLPVRHAVPVAILILRVRLRSGVRCLLRVVAWPRSSGISRRIYCRAAIVWLRVAIVWLRAAVGWLRGAVVWLRIVGAGVDAARRGGRQRCRRNHHKVFHEIVSFKRQNEVGNR